VRFQALLASLVLLVVALAFPRAALAIEYEVFIDVDSEEELYDLWETQQISEETFNTLIELRRRGVDLNHADRGQLYSLPNLTYEDVDRILAYRTEVGTIRHPADLVAAGVLSREKLGSILTFVQSYDARRKLTATHGWVRYLTAWSQEDDIAPPMVIQARITTLRQLSLGISGFVTRQRPGEPVWDPNREALIADQMAVRFNVPKFYAQWDTDRFGVILGTYRIGFGQRLTFDNTDRYTPNGFLSDDAMFRPRNLGLACRESAGELPTSPCTGEAGSIYVTKDFRWRDSLRGVAIGAKHLAVPVGWLQIYGFGSWQPKQIYQYEIYNRDVCDDPRSNDPACSAPTVLVSREGHGPLDPLNSHKFQTFPNMYDEFLGGGNFSWFYNRRTHIGVTGYGATAVWRTKGADLDFQEWSRTPFGGSWGALGADMTWGRRWSDLGVEVARSFDSMKRVTGPDSDYGGGGFAGIVRHTTTFDRNNELELSARYYDAAYANPYAGPISQPDRYHGNTARDETGGRLRYNGRIASRLDLRALADFWVQPRQRAPKMLAYVRSDVDVNRWFRPGLWLQYRSGDLRPNSTLGCANEGDFIVDENQFVVNQSQLIDGALDPGDPATYRFGCLSQVGQVTARMTFRPIKKNRLTIITQYQHEVIEEPRIDRPRQDSAAMLIIRANPFDGLRLSARVRYLFEDIVDNTRWEQSLWTYFDVAYVINRVFLIRMRYDSFVWLDERQRTGLRIPSPEHRLRLELEARF
jgi:hypothetical protein